MGKVIKLNELAAGDELAAIVVNRNPVIFDEKIHNQEFVAMAHSEETRVVGIRFPVELLDWIDRYSRILAIDEKKRVTRNMVVIGFLEQMKAITELQFDGKHIEEIEKVIAMARSQQPAGNADPDLSPAAFDATRNGLNQVG
jgi:hypothetical protein